MATRRDSRDYTKPKPGKRKISYPAGELTVPKIDEEFTHQKRQTSDDGVSPPGCQKYLNPHPDFPNALLVRQDDDPGVDNDKVRDLSYATYPAAQFVGIEETKVNRYAHIPRFVSTSKNTTTVQEIIPDGSVSGAIANPGKLYTLPPVVTIARGAGDTTGIGAEGVTTLNPDGTVHLIQMIKTSGPLVVGAPYIILTLGAGDDFTNVGSLNNLAGADDAFVATGTTPATWTHGTVLASRGTKYTASPTITLARASGDTTGVNATALGFIPNDTPKGFWILDSKTDPTETVFQWNQTITYVDRFETLTTHNAEDEKAQGGATTLVETIVPAGTAPQAASFSVLDTKVEQIDDFRAISSYTSVDGGVFPILIGIEETSEESTLGKFTSTSKKTEISQTTHADGTIQVAVANPGSGYGSAPSVVFAGGDGTGAAATASINAAGQVFLITVTGGINYTVPPAVTLTGGGGTGATAAAFASPDVPKGYWIIRSKIGPENEYRSKSGYAYVDGYQVLATNDAEDNEAWAGATTVTEQIVPAGTTPPAVTFPVLESKVEKIDLYRAIQTRKAIDAGGWPTLTEWHVDSASGIKIRIHKQMVDAAVVSAIALNATPGTNEGAGAGINTVYAPGLVVIPGTSATQIEHQPHDEYRTIQLISDLAQLPSPETYPDVVQISLPDILNSAQVNEAWATDGDGQANSAALQKNITKGYTGPANATVHRQYFIGPPSGAQIPDVTAFFPEEDSLFWYWWYFTSDQYGAEARTFEFPATLHAAITVSIGGSPSGAGVVGTIPATCPTGWTQGQTLVHAAKVEKQQMGVYLLEYVDATIPTC